MTRFAAVLLFATGLAAVPAPRAGGPRPGSAADSAERARAIHLLQRITYGPRPGDVDRVLAMGVDRYLDEQLHPEKISDDSAQRLVRAFPVLTTPVDELARLDARVRLERQAMQRQMGDSARPGFGDGGRPTPPPNSDAARLRGLVAGLQQAAVVRAAVSNRQLYEVMVDFWANHFNVYMAKGLDRILMPSYIEQTIRPNAMGSFEDLLIATAKSPAMLFYLDNAESVAPGSKAPQPGRGRFGQRGRGQRGFGRGRGAGAMDSLRPPRRPPPSGINENYGRELMELHTLGVDGGYTQQDVINAARIFTGWSIQRGPGGVSFAFRDWAHDKGEKTVLGHTFPAGHGMDEGVALLKLLANHPSTMRHVSTELCQRFVSDDPPDGCVDAGVHAWEKSHGDMREVVGAIIRSPEFWAPRYRDAKIKTPLEFVVSAVRALGATPDTLPALARTVARLGQPLFLDQPPTGYPETQDSWINAGALLERLNIAMALASGRLPGVTFETDRLVPATDDASQLADAVNRVVLNGGATANTLRVITSQVADVRSPDAARTLALALALGSPEFQKQ